VHFHAGRSSAYSIPMPEKNPVSTLTNIIPILINNGVSFSFRHHTVNGHFQTVIYSKDARNCMRLFPHSFKLRLDMRQSEIAECVISY
jgi:hypothetical protein